MASLRNNHPDCIDLLSDSDNDISGDQEQIETGSYLHVGAQTETVVIDLTEDDLVKPPAGRQNPSLEVVRHQTHPEVMAAAPSSNSSRSVVLLVDVREPLEYFNALVALGVTCERRTLPTFDFLWISRDSLRNEWILNHGFERKTICDLIAGLDTRENGMARSLFQKLKMNHSGVTHKHYMVQGKVRDAFNRKHLIPSAGMIKRAHQNLKVFEDEGYHMHTFPFDPIQPLVAFLHEWHREMLAVDALTDPDILLPYEVMTARVNWTSKVIAARKILPKPSLGEAKLKCILHEFPLSFESEYLEDDVGIVERLSSLRTNGNRPIMSEGNAQLFCEELFGKRKRVAEGRRRKMQPVTPPSKSQRTQETGAESAPRSVKRQLFHETTPSSPT